MPLSLAIIVGIFLIQRYGTDKVGRLFGPVMVVWFVTIAVLGVAGIAREPAVIAALNPAYGFRFFLDNGWQGFAVLGAVVLAVTGGEALYADMGHFGKRPIRLAWYALVLPSLMLNYFGQGALVLSDQHNAMQPFFLLAPSWFLFPLVLIATAGGRDRVAGAHLRRVLADAAGDPARLRAAARHRAHVASRDGPGLRAAGELGPDVLHHRDRARLPDLHRAGRHLRHRRHHHDGHHRDAAARGDDRALEVAAAARRGHHHDVPRHRRHADGRQPAQGDARWLAAARRRGAGLHADDHVEDRPPAGGRAADGARDSSRPTSWPASRRPSPRVSPARRCS